MNGSDNGRADSHEAAASPFVLIEPADCGVPILLAAPHGGRSYPDELLGAMRDPRLATMRLEDRHADTLAIEVARQTSAMLIYAKAPRALIDLNRSSEDVDWSMVTGGDKPRVRNSAANRRARSGLGLLPRRLPHSGEIWKCPIERAELDRRIDTVHRPYHRAIAGALAQLRDRWGAALLLDIHSMPPLPGRHPDERGAEFVIGDRFGASCEPMLSSRAIAYFGRRERLVAHNRPYAGGFVLDSHGAPGRDIHAMQIEVCRSSYLDADFAEPSARFASVARTLAGLVREMADAIMEIGGRKGLPIAAE